MNKTKLTKTLKNLPIGNIAFFKTIGSTNDLAAEWADQGAPDFSVIAADEQTKGRGRTGRKWYTFPGSALAFSVLLHPPSDMKSEQIHLFTGLGSVAVCAALESLYQLHPEIKWPNDILLDRKKVCGVLTEAHWIGDKLQGIILGIGINVTNRSIPLNQELAYPAVCIEDIVGSQVDRTILLKSILEQIIPWRKKINTLEFIQAWNHRLAFKDEGISLVSPNNVTQPAKLLHLESDGGLTVEFSDGQQQTIKAGGIHLRQAIDS